MHQQHLAKCSASTKWRPCLIPLRSCNRSSTRKQSNKARKRQMRSSLLPWPWPPFFFFFFPFSSSTCSLSTTSFALRVRKLLGSKQREATSISLQIWHDRQLLHQMEFNLQWLTRSVLFAATYHLPGISVTVRMKVLEVKMHSLQMIHSGLRSRHTQLEG